jgi:aromatic ring hydroxylase
MLMLLKSGQWLTPLLNRVIKQKKQTKQHISARTLNTTTKPLFRPKVSDTAASYDNHPQSDEHLRNASKAANETPCRRGNKQQNKENNPFYPKRHCNTPAFI